MEPSESMGLRATAKISLFFAIVLLIGVGIPLLVFLKFDDIAYGIGQLGDRLSKAQMGSVSLEFSPGAIERNVPAELFKYVPAAEKITVTKDISALQQHTVVRLLNVGALDKTCEFELPTAEMAENYTADIKLHEKNLVNMDFDDKKTEAILAEVKSREHSTGKKSEIGDPLRCYNLTLTRHGMDVKTAIIYALGATFAHNAETPSSPTPAKPYNAKK